MSFEKPDAIQSIGLELEKDTILYASLSQIKGQSTLTDLREFHLEENNVKPLYNNTNLYNLIKNQLIVTTLKPSEFLSRPLEIQVKKEKDIDAVLSFQAEPLLPYPIENAILDKVVLTKDREKTNLQIYAAKKDHLAHHISQWKSLNIEPEVVTSSAHALTQFSKEYIKTEDPYLLLHLAQYTTIVGLVINHKLISSQSISIGVEDLQTAYAKDSLDDNLVQNLHSVDFLDLTTAETPHLLEVKDKLYLEFLRIFYALSKQTKGQEISCIFVSGEGASLSNLDASLTTTLGKTLQYPQKNSFFPFDNALLQKFAIPIGAGLSAQPKALNKINFRQQEFVYPNPWKRYKKPLSLYLLACIGLSLSLIFYGFNYLNYQEMSLRKSYMDLLMIMNKSYNDLEKDFYKKLKGQDIAENDIINPQSLSKADLSERLDFLEKEIQTTPEIFPLLPNVPKVSDVLAWLATHPSLLTPNSEAQIENFSYTMIKKPEQNKKGEKYQVKVEFEFSTPTPKQAREFHDALIAPNEFVDQKNEVKWNANRGKYRTSFFLKDKTQYPSAKI
ncbi:type IV pilus assembly protein PilM [Candidatus Rubidus massiliensis]|nr:MAG: hypothetical protein BGO10_02630 [Chlamydia sp. 32-24]CDZ79855.1 type IV pilus assembly protein PilM [Candidatus Rubidus massiliensis]